MHQQCWCLYEPRHRRHAVFAHARRVCGPPLMDSPVSSQVSRHTLLNICCRKAVSPPPSPPKPLPALPSSHGRFYTATHASTTSALPICDSIAIRTHRHVAIVEARYAALCPSSRQPCHHNDHLVLVPPSPPPCA